MRVSCEFQVLKIRLLNLRSLLEVSAEGALSLREVCGKLAEEKHKHNFQQMKDEAAILWFWTDTESLCGRFVCEAIPTWDDTSPKKCMNVFINFRMIRTTDKKHTRGGQATVFLGHFWVSSQEWLCWIYFMATAGFGKGPERIWKVGSGNHPERNLTIVLYVKVYYAPIHLDMNGSFGVSWAPKMIHHCRWGWFGNPWLSSCEICLIQPFRIISRWPSSMIGLKIHRMSRPRWSPAGVQFEDHRILFSLLALTETTTKWLGALGSRPIFSNIIQQSRDASPLRILGFPAPRLWPPPAWAAWGIKVWGFHEAESPWVRRIFGS